MEHIKAPVVTPAAVSLNLKGYSVLHVLPCTSLSDAAHVARLVVSASPCSPTFNLALALEQVPRCAAAAAVNAAALLLHSPA
jgi:hypothetical protein